MFQDALTNESLITQRGHCDPNNLRLILIKFWSNRSRG
jgi:hypothetical protein